MDVFEQSEFKKQISVLYEASLKSDKIKSKVQKLYEKVLHSYFIGFKHWYL